MGRGFGAGRDSSCYHRWVGYCIGGCIHVPVLGEKFCNDPGTGFFHFTF